MDKTFRKELEESINFWERHLKGIKYLPTGKELFDELFPLEERKKILGE